MLVVRPQCHVCAADYTWDASGGTPLNDGSGTWSSSGGTNWFNGTTYGGWGNTTSDVAFFGVASGAAGTVTVSGSVTTNGITFNAAGSGNYTLSGGTIGLGGTTPTITVNASGTSTISSVLSGTSGFLKTGSGILALGTANTYTGTTSINQGTVRASFQSGVFGAGSNGAVLLNGGGIVLTNASNVTPTWNITVGAGGGTLQTGANGRWSLGSSITGSGTLTLASFSGGVNRFPNSGLTGFSGKLVVNSVQLDNPENSLGTATGDDVLTLNGATLLCGPSTIAGGTIGSSTQGITLAGNATFSQSGNSAGPITIAGKVSGSGRLTLNTTSDALSTGTTRSYTLSNAGNSWSGGLTIGTQQGSATVAPVRLGASEVIPNGVGKGDVALNGTAGMAPLDLNGFNETINGLTASDAGNYVDNMAANTAVTLTVGDGNATSTFQGQLRNSGSNATLAFVKIGTGTITLSGSNSYAGNTTISGGRLALGSLGSFASSPVITVGDASSSGAVLDLTAKSSGFTFGSNQTVKGIGTIQMASGQSLTLNGTLAAGNSPGTLTIAGGNLLLGGSSITQYEISGTNNTVGGGINDLTTVSGSLGLGGTLNVIASPAFDVFGNRTYRVFNYATSGTGSLSGNMTIGTTPSTDYLYSLNTATAGQVNLFVQRKEEQSATLAYSLPTSGTVNAFTNTNVSFSGTLTNLTPSGGASLGVSLAGNGGQLSVGSLSASSGTTVASGSSATVTGQIATGTALGARTWSVVNTDATALGSTTSTANGTINVFQRGTPTLSGTVINFGRVLVNGSASQTVTVSNGTLNSQVANTGGITWTAGSTPTGFGIGGSSQAGVIASGSGVTYTYTLATGSAASASGSQSFAFSDDSSILGAGSLGSLAVSLSGTVVNQRSFTLSSGTIDLGYFLKTAASGSTSLSSSGRYDTTASATVGGFTASGTNTGGLSLVTGDSTVFNGLSISQSAAFLLSGSASAGLINGSFSAPVTAELGSISDINVSVVGTALDPALPSWTNWTSGSASAASLLIDLGERNQGSGVASQAFSIWNLMQTAGFTADLDLLTIISGTGNTGAITTDLAAFTGLASGSSNSFLASLSLANTGNFSNTYTLAFTSSKNGTKFNDTTRNLSLTVTGVIVVPEPAGFALAAVGIVGVVWSLRRHGRNRE